MTPSFPTRRSSDLVAGKTTWLEFGPDMVLNTRTGEAEVKVEDSPLVLVGYGVDAPEQDWNDYAGIDVEDKTVVILVNDPGFHAGDESLFAEIGRAHVRPPRTNDQTVTRLVPENNNPAVDHRTHIGSANV